MNNESKPREVYCRGCRFRTHNWCTHHSVLGTGNPYPGKCPENGTPLSSEQDKKVTR